MSLLVAGVATLVSVCIGIVYGAVAGYFGGKIDAVMMRFVDIMYALPYILFVIILVVIFGRHPVLLFVGIGCLEWLTMARIVRGQTLSLKQKEFIEAARAGGARPFAIIMRHIVPNLSGPVVIYATLTVPEIIITESFLSYLGLGVQEPQTSLGTLISFGSPVAESMPWMLLAPASILVTMLICLTYLGDGLRDALDPKDR
jgi:oligopeptide transport system permease protein